MTEPADLVSALLRSIQAAREDRRPGTEPARSGPLRGLGAPDSPRGGSDSHPGGPQGPTEAHSGPVRAVVDPRHYGIGAADVADVTIRGRIRSVGALHLALAVPFAPELVELWIPAESIQNARLVEPRADETTHADAIRAIEDTIDATSDTGNGACDACPCRTPSHETAPAILAALTEQGWTPPGRTTP